MMPGAARMSRVVRTRSMTLPYMHLRARKAEMTSLWELMGLKRPCSPMLEKGDAMTHLQCQCGSREPLHIDATVIVEVTGAGDAVPVSPFRWTPDSHLKCPGCGYEGTVGECTIDDDTPLPQTV